MNKEALKIYDLVTQSHNLYNLKWRDIFDLVSPNVMNVVADSPKVKEFLRKASLGYSVGDAVVTTFGEGNLTQGEKQFLAEIQRALGSIAVFTPDIINFE